MATGYADMRTSRKVISVAGVLSLTTQAQQGPGSCERVRRTAGRVSRRPPPVAGIRADPQAGREESFMSASECRSGASGLL